MITINFLGLARQSLDEIMAILGCNWLVRLFDKTCVQILCLQILLNY